LTILLFDAFAAFGGVHLGGKCDGVVRSNYLEPSPPPAAVIAGALVKEIHHGQSNTIRCHWRRSLRDESVAAAARVDDVSFAA
jgi:hypothetical protein